MDVVRRVRFASETLWFDPLGLNFGGLCGLFALLVTVRMFSEGPRIRGVIEVTQR